MDLLATAILAAVDFMKMEFTVYGYTLSYWDLLLYSLVGSFLIWLIVRFLYE